MASLNTCLKAKYLRDRFIRKMHFKLKLIIHFHRKRARGYFDFTSLYSVFLNILCLSRHRLYVFCLHILFNVFFFPQMPAGGLSTLKTFLPLWAYRAFSYEMKGLTFIVCLPCTGAAQVFYRHCFAWPVVWYYEVMPVLSSSYNEQQQQQKSTKQVNQI